MAQVDADAPPERQPSLGVLAYFYFYPLVENLRQVRRYVETGIGSNPAAAFNTFSHARKLAGPEDTFVTINNDTVYSMAQLDLGVGPLRLEVPEAAGRYYVLQFVDAWTNNIAYVGTRATGDHAGRFVIVPPGYDGALPDGHTPVRASTRIVSIVGRTACAGSDDLPGVHAFQDALVLEAIDTARVPEGLPDLAQTPDDLMFWEQARAWSNGLPAAGEDLTFAQQYSPLGLDQATSPYADADDALHQTLVAAHCDGERRLEYLTHHTTTPVINGWIIGLHSFDYNVHALGLGTIDDDAWKVLEPQRRFIQRAMACRQGLGGNHGYEALYAGAFVDGDGIPLDGHQQYTLTFTELPPVKAFWSLTIYDVPNYYLSANPIDRYSIGDRTPGLQANPNGSLTITISSTEPTDPVARANWLPAPSGRFRPVIRLYMPEQSILDGTYQIPAIARG